MKLCIEAFMDGTPSETFAVDLTSERALTIGRGAGNDVKLSDPSVSRRHAGLRLHGDEIHLDDLGSSHGTFHNDEKIAHAVVKLGDHLRVGSVELRLALPDSSTDRLDTEPLSV